MFENFITGIAGKKIDKGDVLYTCIMIISGRIECLK